MPYASLWGHLGHTLLCHQCSSFWYRNKQKKTKRKQRWAMVVCRPSPQKFRKLRQEDWEFKASLGSFVSPISSLKNQNGWEYSSVVEHWPSSPCRTNPNKQNPKQSKKNNPEPNKQVGARPTLSSRELPR